MIILSDISVTKNGTSILSSISLEITERRVGVIGRNGSGKTTFVKLLNGLEKPSSGSVSLVNGANEVLELSQYVGFVFQNPDNQIVFPIVEEDIAFGLKNSGLEKQDINERIGYYLGKFNLDYLRTRYTHQLSGGEKQLIALIGVLIMEPKYIVLDEPTTLLDYANRLILMNILDDLEQNLIIVSHDLELVADLDRVLLFDHGSLVSDGLPSEVIAKYKEISTC